MDGSAQIKGQQKDTIDRDKEIVGIYNALFDVVSELNSEEKNAAYRLRYQVYVEETGFLPEDENPGGVECDRHDGRSGQSLLVHKLSGELAGVVRIIPPISDMPGCDLPARLASKSLDSLPENMLPRSTTGEISRFSIAKTYRRRREDWLYPAALEGLGLEGDPRRVIPHIALGLMTGVFDQVVRFNLTHLCAVIDPALLRLLRRLGIEFQKVGEPVDFHGPRQPVMARCQDLVEQLYENRPEIYQLVSRCDQLQLPR